MPNGNVGVGTAAPSATLEVAGQIKITGGTSEIETLKIERPKNDE